VSETAGLLASGSSSSRLPSHPAMRDSGRYARSVIRRRSQWRGPRRCCTGFPSTVSNGLLKSWADCTGA